MSYLDDLQAAFDAHPDVADYRIYLGERRTLGIGIRDSNVGSVYSPFSFRQNTAGSFLAQWQDGKLSRSTLDGNSLPIIAHVLANARLAAYDDPDGAQFLGPQEVHEVSIFADDIPPLFDERTGYLLEVVATLQALAQTYEAQSLEGGVGAAVGQISLRTSRGLALNTPGTRFTYSAYFDGLIGENKEQCALATQDEIRAQIDLAGQYLAALRTPARPLASGTYTVILHPGVVYDIFNHYVWANLSGAAVYHHRSPFSVDDFRNEKQVFRHDLQVMVEPWKPLSANSLTFTEEGVPTAPTTYIENGRLKQPVLDLKYARRLGLAPNTPPNGQESIHISAQTEIDWNDLCANLDEAILVLSMLGLHTQDRTSGSYSVATAQALLIRDGRVQGSIKAILNGNLFSNLCDDALQIVRFPGYPGPGFALPLRVTIE